MTGLRGPLGGSASSVVRQIDQELDRLNKYEKALATQRELLLSARAALTRANGGGPVRRRPVSQGEIAAYLAGHPGCSATQIANALQASTANVSAHLHRGKHTLYRRHEDGWYPRPRDGGDA